MSFARKFVDKKTHRISLIDRIWILSVILGYVIPADIVINNSHTLG